MKNKVFILAGLWVAAFTAHALDWPDAQITFKVKDDSGKLLSGVSIDTIVFSRSKPATYEVVSSKTDAEGIAVVKAANVFNEYSYSVENFPGYYSAGGVYSFQIATNGQWQPWNPTVEMVLKPKLNPVPMYAKQNRDLRLPENDKPIGYDLMVGDWVAPYGKGLTSDFIFNLQRKFTDVNQAFDAALAIKFSNDGDGVFLAIARSCSDDMLRLPRTAPETGYESQVVLRMYREAGKPMVGVLPKEDQNYFFRVRTKKDENGNIVSALYGKIHGGINYGVFRSPTALIYFTYYLNPEPNSRNMEFNPKKNLFKNLDTLEQVTAP